MDLAEKALRLVGLQSDMRFLDVAAGSGALSIPAARLGAQVFATDSPAQAPVPGFTGLPLDPPPLACPVADPEKLRQPVANAGLSEIRVETATWKMAFQSGKHLWDFVTNGNPSSRTGCRRDGGAESGYPAGAG